MTFDEERARTRLDGRRVLVVDDNVDGADSLGLMLQLLGAETAVAYDGASALQLAADFHPDTLVLDISMPVMDGHEIARRIRGGPGGPNLHIVALTGWSQTDDLERSRLAGFDWHLVKPVDLSQLLTALGS